jgi:hypothetical protein
VYRTSKIRFVLKTLLKRTVINGRINFHVVNISRCRHTFVSQGVVKSCKVDHAICLAIESSVQSFSNSVHLWSMMNVKVKSDSFHESVFFELMRSV